MRTQIVAGNWKMNKDVAGSKALAMDISEALRNIDTDSIRIILAPSFTNLYPVFHQEGMDPRIEIVAQNMHQELSGAYTGEISAEMLKSIGIRTVILGHSERRTYFNETDALLAEKVNTAFQQKMDVIFCLGEILEERKARRHFKVVEHQLEKGLFQLNGKDWENLVLAYEPVWAIGTGETATPEQAQEMHAFIRKVVGKKYGESIALQTSILYGGSIKPNNAKAIFSQPDVDGGLIGGAALNANDFVTLIQAI